MKTPLLISCLKWFSSMVLLLLIAGMSSLSVAQNFSTSNQFIFANVVQGTGIIQVLLPPGTGTSPQLSFPNKSFFSCLIGNQVYTNNDVGTKPANAGANYILNDATITKIADTIHVVWTRSKVDIIQDVYPIAFEKSGQIGIRWSFINHNDNSLAVGCQYLNDIDIADPREPGPNNGTDGPIILNRYTYLSQWQQFTAASTPPLPWFYIAFLHNLPTTSPGLSAQGFLDNPSVGTIKPYRFTIGQWPVMVNTVWSIPTGSGAWPIGQSMPTVGNDAAVLMEFSVVGVPGKGAKTVVGGATTYGTGEFEMCNGNLVGILFYPHRLKWDKTLKLYSPNPFNVEMLVFNPSQTITASNTYFTLTAGPNLNLVSAPPNYTPIGVSQQLPSAPGMVIPPGNVGLFDWYLKADPAYLCTGDVLSNIKITGTSTISPFAFDDDTCAHDIIMECAESDVDPPLYENQTEVKVDTAYKLDINFHDDRSTDRGLKSIIVQPKPGTDSTKFLITFSPATIKPCATDKDVHTVTITQLDSTVKGCFDLTFEDCLGHQSFEEVCLNAHTLIRDTLAPQIFIISRSGSYDGSICNNLFDSLLVTDSNTYDKGIDSVIIAPNTTPDNMTLVPSPITVTSGSAFVRFSVQVQDKFKNGSICIEAIDHAKNRTDTCLSYCTIADILKPRVFVNQNAALHQWIVTVLEDSVWDRLIDSIYLTNEDNVTYPPSGFKPTLAQTRGQQLYTFTVQTIDTTKPSGFCVEATDLAGNRSDKICVSQGVDTDGLAPNIVFDKNPSTNPTTITVTVNDIHFNDPGNNRDTVVWDTGIKKIWFTSVSGMKVTDLSGSPITDTIFVFCAKVAPSFKISVIDSLNTDSLACITVNAADCHNNTSAQQWCYPYTPDTKAPVLFARYIDKQQIQVIVTDSTTYDRGNKSMFTSGEVNLTPFSMTANNTPINTFMLTRPILGQSSYATVGSIDYWGSLAAYRVPTHSASVNIQVWVQDFAMRKGAIIQQAQGFVVPIYVVKNDTIPMSRKKISDFKFSFTLQGDAQSIQFMGVDQASSLTRTGWTVTPTVVGNTVTIHGSMDPGGSVLSDATTADSVLVYLKFQAQKNENNQDVVINIDNTNGETIIYNNGIDTVINGLSATAIMPAPWGTLSGMHIVIVGSCSPLVKSSNATKATSTMLDVPNPNPVTHSVTIHYAIAKDGLTKVSIYDMLGHEAKVLVSVDQKQGYYDLTTDLSDLAAGQYVLRLEQGTEIHSRIIGVQK